jgi:hypothetical protein
MTTTRVISTLEDATWYILEHAEPQARGRMIHWFLEGLPLTMGLLVSPEGERCFLGSLLPADATNVLCYDSVLHRVIPVWEAGSYGDLWGPFDRAFMREGEVATRARVVAVIREWLRLDTLVGEPSLQGV